MGTDVTVELVRRRYYPRGGAAMRAELVTARKRDTLKLSGRCSLKQVKLFSQAANVLKPRKVAERQIDGALAVLDSLHAPARLEVQYGPSFSAGSSLCIVAEFCEYGRRVRRSRGQGETGGGGGERGGGKSRAGIPEFSVP